jgi:chorismate synthase
VDDDFANEEVDTLSDEFIKLLKTITREEVDKHVTRCPHPETAERMTKVRPPPSNLSFQENIHRTP